MASVSHRTLTDGTVRWRVQYRINGKLTTATFDNSEAAHQFGRLVDTIGGAAAKEVLDARRRDHHAPTLREFTDRYLDAASGLLTGIEPGTRADYQGAATRSFLRILGDYPIDVIQPSDVGRWVAWQEQQPTSRDPNQLVSAKTVKNYHSLLSAVMAAAVAEKHRPDNPAHGTRLSRGVSREAVFLSVEEFETLLAFVPHRWEPLVTFLAGTGCRWGEATALTWADLSLTDAPTVRISKAWKRGGQLGPPKSEKSRRTVSLYPDLVHALGKPGRAGDLVFQNGSGGRVWYGRFRTSVWEKAVDAAMDSERCQEAGVRPITRRPTPHDLRHSHASWLLASGVPLHAVQARLGHESVTTTVDVYGHLVPDAHAGMAGVIAATLASVRPLRELT